MNLKRGKINFVGTNVNKNKGSEEWASGTTSGDWLRRAMYSLSISLMPKGKLHLVHPEGKRTIRKARTEVNERTRTTQWYYLYGFTFLVYHFSIYEHSIACAYCIRPHMNRCFFPVRLRRSMILTAHSRSRPSHRCIILRHPPSDEKT